MPRAVDLHITSQQGWRVSNEDVELAKLGLATNGEPAYSSMAPVDIFIVCDGHSYELPDGDGDRVAKYVAPRLKKYLTAPNLVYPLDEKYIYAVYDSIQKKIIEHPKNIGLNCGCTALVVIRYSKNGREYLQVINLGDCRAILSRKGLAIQLTKDHKPSWPDERKRIDQVNAKYKTREPIEFEGDWRICGMSVSRSFGDIESTPFITHVPEIFLYQLQKEDEFFFLSCDGLFESVDNNEAVNFLKDHYEKNDPSLYDLPGLYPSQVVRKSKCLARKLASYAIARGSSDNVSIIAVFFNN